MQRTARALGSLFTAVTLVLALGAGAARAAQTADATLPPMTDAEFYIYARALFETLHDEARSTHNVSTKFRPQCRADAASGSDAARACTIVRAADEQSAELLEQEETLMRRLENRFGAVPRWAQAADATFRETLAQ